jgi:putative ABC transport system permease protein
MNPHAFRSALRMARREAWRNRWRSLLVVLLIGFPVFVLGCGDIAYRSWQLDPSERLTREIGASDAAVQPGCGLVEQVPSAWLGDGYRCGSQEAGPTPTPTLAQLLAQLPAGTRAIERTSAPNGVRVTTNAGVKYTNLVGFDYADPLAHGIVHQLHGRSPRTAGEVALTTALAKSIGLGIGDTMHLVDPDRTFTVVGIVRDARYRKIQTAYTLPSAIDHTEPTALNRTWYVHTSTPVTWGDVLRLNEASFVVLSRSVYLDPPPHSQVPFYTNHPGTNHLPAQVIATVTLVGGMALLEVVLLAGPAFAVGARRQRRELALITAVGGQTRDLRNVVLANGVVLGVIAGVSAAFGAVLAALIGMPTLGTLVDQIPGHTDIRPLELAGIAMLSLVTALLAAIFPALQAGRTDVIAALAGRRGAVRTRRHVPVIGAVIAAIGVAIAFFGVTRRNDATTILAGVVFTEVGLIVCTPTLLGAAARLGRLLPLAPRIALRDAGRNRSAATPAVAAVMASMIGAVGILIAVTSSQDQDRRNYEPTLPNHAVYASGPFGDGVAQGTSTDSIRNALGATLPIDQVAVVRAPQNDCAEPTAAVRKCRVSGLIVIRDNRAGSRYHGGAFPEVLVDDGSGVAALFGKPEPAAAAALRAGHAVVTDSGAVHNGTIQLGVIDETAAPVPDGPPPTIGTPVTLPATVVTDGFAAAAAIVPASALSTLGTSAPIVLGVLATTTREPTDKELQAARGRLEQLDARLSLDMESGWHNPTTWALYLLIGFAALIALGAASIATALANADGRDDLVTLGAVGASPRTRRLMSMSRAGVVAGLGCLIGVAAGFVPAYAWTRGTRAAANHGGRYVVGGLRDTTLHFVVPWTPILLALVGVPLVAAGVAGLFTRSRLPSERRTE